MNAPPTRLVADSIREVETESATATPSWPLTRHRTLRTPRRRRRGQRDADLAVHNHASERWMISYADFITLLFAFFVVMYATTSVDRNRFSKVSGALSTAFSPPDPKAPIAPSTPVVVPKAPAEQKLDATAKTSVPEAKAVPIDPVDPEERAEMAKNAERVEHMKQLATRVDEHLQTLVRDGQVQVTRGARGIAIEINAAVLFDPAKADLKPESFAALRSLAGVAIGLRRAVADRRAQRRRADRDPRIQVELGAVGRTSRIGRTFPDRPGRGPEPHRHRGLRRVPTAGRQHRRRDPRPQSPRHAARDVGR